MLQDDQHHLGQQHAEKDDHAAGLEQQNADDRAGIEQQGAGHRHDEHVVHVQQRALAVQRGLDANQQRADAENQLAVGDLLGRPARRQGVEHPVAGQQDQRAGCATEQHDAPVEPARDGFEQRLRLAAQLLQVGNHGVAQCQAQEVLEEQRQDERNEDEIRFPAEAERAGNEQVAKKTQKKTGDSQRQNDQRYIHSLILCGHRCNDRLTTRQCPIRRAARREARLQRFSRRGAARRTLNRLKTCRMVPVCRADPFAYMSIRKNAVKALCERFATAYGSRSFSSELRSCPRRIPLPRAPASAGRS